MFGRRNSDTTSTVQPKPKEESVDLDMLANLPELPAATGQRQTMIEAPAFEHAWQPEQSVAYQPMIPEPQLFVPPTPTTPMPFTSDEPVGAPVFAAPATVPTTRTKAASESVIGPDDFFDGNYRSERGVRLQGNVHGSIESRQYIFVENGARVEASLSAEEITIAGEFTGTIECRQRLEISATGRVHGQVTTASLIVHEGGLLDGELHMKQA